MEQKKFEEVIEKLEIPKEKWVMLRELRSIVLKNGVGIYPNWAHLRFLITQKGDILIKHGTSKPYGGRLSPRFMFSVDNTSISFPPGNSVYPSEYYNLEDVPEFKTGVIIRASEGKDNILSETIVKSVSIGYNMVSVSLTSPLRVTKNALLSFYDPGCMGQDSIHGTAVDGIYLNFIENNGKKDKKYGTYHEIIKVKDIAEINLLLAINKTYKIN